MFEVVVSLADDITMIFSTMKNDYLTNTNMLDCFLDKLKIYLKIKIIKLNQWKIYLFWNTMKLHMAKNYQNNILLTLWLTQVIGSIL